jgi:hypothetical protein
VAIVRIAREKKYNALRFEDFATLKLVMEYLGSD